MGWVYVAFVIDAYARRILGCKVSTRMTTPAGAGRDQSGDLGSSDRRGH